MSAKNEYNTALHFLCVCHVLSYCVGFTALPVCMPCAQLLCWFHCTTCVYAMCSVIVLVSLHYLFVCHMPCAHSYCFVFQELNSELCLERKDREVLIEQMRSQGQEKVRGLLA